MIAKIETHITQRLAKGLGSLVREVSSYSGELDDEMTYTLRVLPAVWVTFGGLTIKAATVSSRRFANTGKFIVMVATRSVRSDAARRRGGIDDREIGSYQLISAVRRLLDRQGLAIGIAQGLQPAGVRPIFNHQNVGGSTLSVYAIEYSAVWHDDDDTLADGAYPHKVTDSSVADHVFTKYQGQLSPPEADLLTVAGAIVDPTTTAHNPINVYLRGHHENH